MLSGALGRGCKKIGIVVCECECVMVEEGVAGVALGSTKQPADRREFPGPPLARAVPGSEHRIKDAGIYDIAGILLQCYFVSYVQTKSWCMCASPIFRAPSRWTEARDACWGEGNTALRHIHGSCM